MSLADRIRIRSTFEAEKCDPAKRNITYCVEYNTEKCPMTCDYAIERVSTRRAE